MADQTITLVAGGTGFLGRHLVRKLLAEGRTVRLLCRNPAKARALFDDSAEVSVGDLGHPASLLTACRGARSVLNLGGLYEFGAGHRAAMWQTNVVGTNNLLSACWKASVECVVHCSTAGILTPNGESPLPPGFLEYPPAGCHYKRSKWEGERIAMEWAERGLPVMIASPTALLGAEDERPTPTGRMIVDLLAGRFPCYSRTGFNVIAVEDAAAGILAIAQNGKTGRRYLLADRNLWLGEFLQMVAAAAQMKGPGVILPWPFIAIGGLLGEVWALAARSGHGRLCLETAHFARRRQFFNSAATTEQLGWSPNKPVEDAIADGVAWVNRHHPASTREKSVLSSPQTSA